MRAVANGCLLDMWWMGPRAPHACYRCPIASRLLIQVAIGLHGVGGYLPCVAVCASERSEMGTRVAACWIMLRDYFDE